MEIKRPSDKFDGSVMFSPYRRASEKYDPLASRGSISQTVTCTDELLLKNKK